MIEKDPIKIIVGELLTPSNIELYQEILNTPLDTDKSEYIDACLKYLHWELENTEETKEEIVEEPIDNSFSIPIHIDGIRIDDTIIIRNATNKTLEGCIGRVIDFDITEDDTLLIVKLSQLTVRAIFANMTTDDIIVIHPDEVAKWEI